MAGTFQKITRQLILGKQRPQKAGQKGVTRLQSGGGVDGHFWCKQAASRQPGVLQASAPHIFSILCATRADILNAKYDCARFCFVITKLVDWSRVGKVLV